MSFGNLKTDSDTSTTDYTFRADVKDFNGNDADACEGDGLGVKRYMYKVDEDPETRTGTVSGDCPAGSYLVVASIARDGSQAAQAQAELHVLPVLLLLVFPQPIAQGQDAQARAELQNLRPDSDASTVDYVFRADVKDGEGNDADACEGAGMGADRNINEVGEGAESYTFTIAGDCPAGAYRAELTLSDPQGAKLTGAQYDFNVGEGYLTAPQTNNDATLSALSLDTVETTPAAVTLTPAFASATTEYAGAVTNSVEQVTVTATATASQIGATVAYLDDADAALTDADGSASGFQVALTEGAVTTFKVKVTAADGTTTQTYTLRVGRDSAESKGRMFTRDFDTLSGAGNNHPEAIWSDGETMWAVDRVGKKIYAYDLATKAYESGKDFNSLDGAQNKFPRDLWSDGETVWVANDNTHFKLFTYKLSDRTRLDTGPDINSLNGTPGNANPTGIWSDGDTMWVADRADDKLYAYRMSASAQTAADARVSAKEFSLDADNGEPRGMWSDSETIWVVNDKAGNRKLYAYTLDGGARDTAKDIPLDEIDSAGGVWSDGETMYVSDPGAGDKIYAYVMIKSTNADLESLTVSLGTLDPAFAPGTTSYTVDMGGAASLTVNAKARYKFAEAVISPSQPVTVPSTGSTTVTITVTAQDGATIKTYTVVASQSSRNNPPTVANEIPDQSATAGTAFSYAFPADTFSDPDTGYTLTYTATKSDGDPLPSWLTFTADTRTFSGTPTASDGGKLTIKVTASDGTDSVSDSFGLLIEKTLVSNFGQTESGGISVNLGGAAQAFTNGASTDYFLTSIEVKSQEDNTISSSKLKAELWTANSSGNLDARVATLTNPSGDTLSGTIKLSAPANTVLSANTKYLLVIPRTGVAYSLVYTASGAQTGETGWTIDDDRLDQATVGNTWTTTGEDRPLHIKVNGAPVPANSAPTASDNTVTTGEDADYTFAATDFNFADKDGDELASVKIVALPAGGRGSLVLDGTAVTTDQVITKADIDAGKLEYGPPANANGSAFAAFAFTVNDGTDDSASVYTMVIDVTAVNDAPTASDKTVTTNEDTVYTFAASDFNFADVDSGAALASVKVVTLPANGSLTLDGAAVTTNQVITKTDIDAGKLKYGPPVNANGSGYASFTFKVNDGAADSASAYTMTIDVTPVNDLPTGSPTVTGNAVVGGTLTADPADIRDADGLPGTFDWQWARDDGTTKTDIPGANSPTYTPVAADLCRQLRVRVNFTDNGGTRESITTAGAGLVRQTQGANCAPEVVNPIPDQTATENVAFSYAFADNTFRDADTGATLTYTATKGDGTALPAWLTFTPGARAFTGTPAVGDGGTLTVQVTASDGDDTMSDTFDITVRAAPVFPSTTSTTFTVPEDAAAGTNVGLPFPATDANGDALTYSLEGAAAGPFTIDPATGQMTVGAPLDYETINSHEFKVRVSDGQYSNTVTVTVTVVNVTEPPGPPAAPLVATRSRTSVTVNWSPPENTGPPITDYDYRWRPEGGSSWTEVTDTAITDRSETIGGLTDGTRYEAQVRAKNDDGVGPWSATGEGRAQNLVPRFPDEDATLKQVSLRLVSHTPANFDRFHTAYASRVPWTTASTEVVVETNNPGASYRIQRNGHLLYKGKEPRNVEVRLEAGETTNIDILVTSPNGRRVVYRFAVYRGKSDDTRLGKLEVSDGNTVLDLDPTFGYREPGYLLNPYARRFGATVASNQDKGLTLKVKPFAMGARINEIRKDGTRAGSPGDDGAEVSRDITFSRDGITQVEIDVRAENGDIFTYDLMVHVKPTGSAGNKVYAELLPQAGGDGVTLYAKWDHNSNCVEGYYVAYRYEHRWADGGSAAGWSGAKAWSEIDKGRGHQGSSGKQVWVDGSSVLTLFGNQGDQRDIEIWCGERPYWLPGMTLRHADSTKIGEETITLPAALSVSGETAIDHPENQAGAVVTYRATDGSGTVRWSLRGEDAHLFTIDGGALGFREPPDYEISRDDDSDGVYEVNVIANRGVMGALLQVSVTVTDQND